MSSRPARCVRAGAHALLLGALLLSGPSDAAADDERSRHAAAAFAERGLLLPDTVDARQARCVALAMYWEAKAEGRRGMRAVGHVVLNRVDHEEFPDTPCRVVYQGGEQPPCQFSWYCDGRPDRPREPSHWREALRLAIELLTDSLDDITDDALFFHARHLENPWRVARERTVVIGDHVFYR